MQRNLAIFIPNFVKFCGVRGIYCAMSGTSRCKRVNNWRQYSRHS